MSLLFFHLGPGPLAEVDLVATVLTFISLTLTIAACVGVAALIYLLLSLPGRRRDRAAMFLDLVETALQRGETVESAVLAVAESRDPVMGVHFYLLAAHLEGGARFGEALERTPGLLPPAAAAMLRAGERMGDLRSVLPACRETIPLLRGSQQTSVSYIVSLMLLLTPMAMWIMCLLNMFVLPKFKELFAGMGTQLPVVTLFLLDHLWGIVWVELVLYLTLLTSVVVHLGGPGVVRHVRWRSLPVVDWLAWRLVWKRKTLQRNFSAMLAVLLDHGVPESEAVLLAGETTANEICRRRAERISQALAAGVSLTEAVRRFDDSGEFHWRLANAVHARGGFLVALRGWHESLEAKAFHQREAATQLFTSGLVILNGTLVGLIVIGFYAPIIGILKNMLATL